MTFALKYEHVSAFEDPPDGSFKGAPTFEAKIKGALEATIEIHWKMDKLVHL